MRGLKGSSKMSPAIASSCAPSDRGTQVQVIIFPRRELIYSATATAPNKSVVCTENSIRVYRIESARLAR
jgi:hypothetical protein